MGIPTTRAGRTERVSTLVALPCALVLGLAIVTEFLKETSGPVPLDAAEGRIVPADVVPGGLVAAELNVQFSRNTWIRSFSESAT